jgi:hypothetical protein
MLEEEGGSAGLETARGHDCDPITEQLGLIQICRGKDREEGRREQRGEAQRKLIEGRW